MYVSEINRGRIIQIYEACGTTEETRRVFRVTYNESMDTKTVSFVLRSARIEIGPHTEKTRKKLIISPETRPDLIPYFLAAHGTYYGCPTLAARNNTRGLGAELFVRYWKYAGLEITPMNELRERPLIEAGTNAGNGKVLKR